MNTVKRILMAVSTAGMVLAGTLALVPAASSAYGQVLPPDDDTKSNENWNTFGAESGPKLTVLTDGIDLGEINDAARVKRTIPFKNTGTGLLTIERVNTSCGCTAAELETHDYLPGEGGEINITYDPTGRSGKQRKIITIISNDRDNRLTQVVLTCDIDPIIEVDQNVVTARNVVYGEGAETRVVFSCDWKVFKPKSVNVVGSYVEPKIEKVEEVELPDGRKVHRVTVLVKIDKEAPIGYVRRNLDLLAEVGDGESEPFEHQASVSVNVNVVGDLEVVPARISFGRLEAGQDYERMITVRSRRGSDFKVTGAEFVRDVEGEPRLSIEEATDENGQKVVHVFLRGTAPAKPGIVNGAFKIVTDQEEQKEIDVTVVGSITRPRR